MSRLKKHKIKKRMPYQKKRKKFPKEILWTLIIAGLMIASVFGIMFSGYATGGEKEPYNGYEFIKTNQGWKVTVQDKNFVFQYHPADLDTLNIDPEISKTLRGSKMIYLTFNPNSEEVEQMELARFQLGSFLTEIQVYPVMGITEENENYKQPLIDCYNATQMVPVIKLVGSNETGIYQEDGCIIVEAYEYDIPPMVDRLAYATLGIIE